MTLELRGVVKHYRAGTETIRAIDGVSLTVAPGEFVAVYGPSGSGKSTLLLLAAGLMSPEAGTVCFDGRDISALSPFERARYRRGNVGVVFQFFHLMPSGTALENAALKLVAEGLSMGQAERAARPWLERVGLQDRLSHRSTQLSMGERQRVAIARALANEPRLLLTDEPTGNLDSKRSRETLALLRDICHERAIPVVIVTHDSQAMAFVDRVHTLSDGHIEDGLNAELAVT